MAENQITGRHVLQIQDVIFLEINKILIGRRGYKFLKCQFKTEVLNWPHEKHQITNNHCRGYKFYLVFVVLEENHLYFGKAPSFFPNKCDSSVSKI